jgi:hypothetical protein
VNRVAALMGVAAALVASSCSLGAKQTLADRVIRAADRLHAQGSATGTIDASVALVKSDKPLVPGPPKILPAKISDVPAVFDLARGDAAVGVKDGDPKTAVVVFRGTHMYQRIAPKTASVADAVLSSAASNLQPLVAAYHGITLENPKADAAATTTTTVKHAALRRVSRIPREWIAFDFSEIDKDDTTKRAGSFAINPTVLLRLAKGVLTGSIERHGDRYDANVNRDKAERRLDEDERKELDKMFKANAVSGRTFKARIWLDRAGALRRFEVRLRQRLTSIDRADLTVTMDIDEAGSPVRIAAPSRAATATVSTLGQLVTAVSRA